MKGIYLLSLLLASSCMSQVFQDTETKAIADITGLITELSAPGSPIANPAAKLVRLVFHDCASGCDGCLNFDNIENNGLMDTYREVNMLYRNGSYNESGMSRADFVALAGTVAIRQASMEQDCRALRLPPNCVLPVPNITLKYGRRDCPTSPRTDEIIEFPDAHRDLAHVLNFFQTKMNMTVRDTVAIIGAHSLGAAGFRTSGFNGPWAPPTTRFDNGFYRVLNANQAWRQQELNDSRSPVFPQPRYQWTRPNNNGGGGGNLIMLNTDMVLLRDIDPDSTGRETNATCQMDSRLCPLSMTANIVMEFATNNTAFFEAFGPAFQKLVQTGYREDELMTARAIMPTPSSTPTQSPTPTTLLTDGAVTHHGQAVYLIVSIALLIVILLY